MAASLALAVAFADFHRELANTSKGTSPAPYFTSLAFLAFCALIAALGAIFFAIAELYPKSWVDNVVGSGFPDPLAKAAAVGLATIVLLRSRFYQHGPKLPIGGEFFYVAVRDWAIDGYKTDAAMQRMECAYECAALYGTRPNFDTDLVTMVRNALDHRADRLKKFDAQIKTIPQVHEQFLFAAIDHIGIGRTKRWLRRHYGKA